jgi:CBS domain-containing protein
MWDHDCGAIPILDACGHTVAMDTDRDNCMAAYIQGKRLRQIPVTLAGSRRIHAVRPDESLAVAHQLMRVHRVRRLPVIDTGGNLVGILSLADIVRRARSSGDPADPLRVENVASTLAEVMRPACLPMPGA